MASLQPILQISEKATAAFTNQQKQVWHQTRRSAQATARGTNRLERHLQKTPESTFCKHKTPERSRKIHRTAIAVGPLPPQPLQRICLDLVTKEIQNKSLIAEITKGFSAAQTLMRGEKPSSAKTIRETRLQAVRRPGSATPESSASEMETLRSSTEHHTKPGDVPRDITSQCRKQTD